MSRPNMRLQMPVVAAFIDDLRDAFGAEEVTGMIRRGLWSGCSPEQRFFASEAGHVLGERYVPSGTVVSGEQMMLKVAQEEDAIETPKRGRGR